MILMLDKFDDVKKIKRHKMVVDIMWVGSRYTTTAPPTPTSDWDYIILPVKTKDIYQSDKIVKYAKKLGFKLYNKGDIYRNSHMRNGFVSLKKTVDSEVVNLLVSRNAGYWNGFLEATHWAKEWDVHPKQRRIELFAAIMNDQELPPPWIFRDWKIFIDTPP